RAAATRPGRGRGTAAVRTPLLQRCSARSQRCGPAIPRPRACTAVRLHFRGILRSRRCATGRCTGGSGMNRFLTILAFLALLCTSLPADARERILSYDSSVTVNGDGSLDVV